MRRRARVARERLAVADEKGDCEVKGGGGGQWTAASDSDVRERAPFGDGGSERVAVCWRPRDSDARRRRRNPFVRASRSIARGAMRFVSSLAAAAVAAVAATAAPLAASAHAGRARAQGERWRPTFADVADWSGRLVRERACVRAAPNLARHLRGCLHRRQRRACALLQNAAAVCARCRHTIPRSR